MYTRRWLVPLLIALASAALLAGLALLAAGAVAQGGAATDLRLVPVSFPRSGAAGAALRYELALGNAGPAAADAVQVLIFPPDGMSLSGLAIGGGSCEIIREAPASCTLRSLAAGITRTLTFSATVAPEARGLAVLSAHASHAGLDPQPADNAPALSTLLNSADMALSASSASRAALDGGSVSFTLTARNNGPIDLAGATLHLRLPAGVEPSNLPRACTFAIDTYSCALGAFKSGDTRQIPLELRVFELPDASFIGAAYLAAPGDPNLGNNAADLVLPANSADLNVSVGAAEQPAPGLLRYRFLVRNGGPAPATGVTLQLTLPSGAGLAGGLQAAGCGEQGGLVICSVPDLADGQSQELVIDLSAPPGGGRVVVSAAAFANEGDPEPADNTPVASVVAGAPDLGALAVSSRAQVRPGDRLSYTITISNSGSAPATGVTLRAFWAANISPGAATPSQGSCAAALGGLTCSLGGLAAGASATISVPITALPPDGRFAVSSLTVSANEADPEPANNNPEVATLIDAREIYLPAVLRR